MLALYTALLLASGVQSAAPLIPASTVSFSNWAALNSTVGGRLHTGKPIALPCFSRFDDKTVTLDPEACSTVEANYTNPLFRFSHYEALMQPQWEGCQTALQECVLDGSNPSNQLALSGRFQCSQGSVSPYYIDVRQASDVRAAFLFSASNRVPLAIKNTGHDFIGRSATKGSLGVWTHNLRNISHSTSFVPEGCPDSYNALTIGAGVPWQDAYAFADSVNVTVIGGYHQTVGASGGWLMGGGHSILSPVFGLGVDRVVQFKVVTPDGKLRTANACQNSDLFWALRGGGGGTFGVVLESTTKVEKQMSLQVSSLKFTASANNSNMPQFYKTIIDNSIKWGSEGWGGHLQASSLIYVNPKLSLDEARASMKPIADYVGSQNGTVVIETVPSWNTFFKKYAIKAEVGVGQLAVGGSRLIPQANFETEAGKSALLNTLVDMLPISYPYIPVVPPVLYDGPANATSVTPAWRKALWHVTFGDTFRYNSTLAEQEATYKVVTNITQTMRAITPGSGAYHNEADVYEPDHENSFWGDNYPRLLQIKEKYDPHGLLQCWHCVGWTGALDKRYRCYLPQ